MKNIPFSFTNTFSNSCTYTCPITSTSSYTHTNSPYQKRQAGKGLTRFLCQNKAYNFLVSDGCHSASASINSSRWAMPAGKNPLYGGIKP